QPEVHGRAIPGPDHERTGAPEDLARADPHRLASPSHSGGSVSGMPAMQTRRLGRTGHLSSLAILGAAAFWDSTAEATAAGFDAALAAGVNHLDIAPQYGRAQELVGPLVPAVRDRLFVACKTMRHDPAGVRAQLEESLTLLRCDSFDLYQMHAVTHLDELDARARAVTAILAARDEGLCRFVGITGHNLSTPVA